jgi:hypothetical protein
MSPASSSASFDSIDIRSPTPSMSFHTEEPTPPPSPKLATMLEEGVEGVFTIDGGEDDNDNGAKEKEKVEESVDQGKGATQDRQAKKWVSNPSGDQKSPTAVTSTDGELCIARNTAECAKEYGMTTDKDDKACQKESRDESSPARDDEIMTKSESSHSFRLPSAVVKEAQAKIRKAREDRARSRLPKSLIPFVELMLPANKTLGDAEADFCRMFTPCSTGSYYLNYNSSKSLSYTLNESNNCLTASQRSIRVPIQEQRQPPTTGSRAATKTTLVPISGIRGALACPPQSAFSDVFTVSSDVSSDLMFEDVEGEISYDARKGISPPLSPEEWTPSTLQSKVANLQINT